MFWKQRDGKRLKWKETKIGLGSSVGTRISLQFNFLQTLTLCKLKKCWWLQEQDTGFSLSGGMGGTNAPRLLHGCSGGTVVLQPLYAAVGAGPGSAGTSLPGAVLPLG